MSIKVTFTPDSKLSIIKHEILSASSLIFPLIFASEFGYREWAYLAGLWHDLGKYSEGLLA